MSIDQLSYSLKCNKNRNKNFQIPTNISKAQKLNISLYSSNNVEYTASSYKLVLYPDKTYDLLEKIKYSNKKHFGGFINLSIYEYIKKHKNWIICLKNLNEHPEYPFKNLNVKKKKIVHISGQPEIPINWAHLKLYNYHVPVWDICDNNKTEDDLLQHLRFHGYDQR